MSDVFQVDLKTGAKIARSYTAEELAALPPPPTYAEAKSAKLAALAALRYARETAGIGGFRTDRESQALLTGAALAATLDAAYTVDWKGDGGWITLNAAQLLDAAQAVRAHVQACFSAERAHAEAIEALTTVAAVTAYDFSTGWP
ncbi:MAG: DUF4376 domain-containing protein [Tagaea sp.]|nr:DUF4376 domain-containing protein [Tagaea sp.]